VSSLLTLFVYIVSVCSLPIPSQSYFLLLYYSSIYLYIASLVLGGLAGGAPLSSLWAPGLLFFTAFTHREVLMDITDIEGKGGGRRRKR